MRLAMALGVRKPPFSFPILSYSCVPYTTRQTANMHENNSSSIRKIGKHLLYIKFYICNYTAVMYQKIISYSFNFSIIFF